jgi:hypothetical protein
MRLLRGLPQGVWRVESKIAKIGQVGSPSANGLGMKYLARVFDGIVIEFGTDGQTRAIVIDGRGVRAGPHAYTQKQREHCKKYSASVLCAATNEIPPHWKLLGH